MKNKLVYRCSVESRNTDLLGTITRIQDEAGETLESEKWNNYSEGSLKKQRVGFPVFKITFQLRKDCNTNHIENEFKQIIHTFTQQNIQYSLRDLEGPALNSICIFYVFFWDILNKTFLRDRPSLYDIISKTSVLDEAVMILAPIIGNDSSVLIKSPAYDPNYRISHSYLFNAEEVDGDQLILLYKKIKALFHTLPIKSVSEKDLPPGIKEKIDRLVKDRIFRRRPITSKRDGEVSLAPENMSRDDLHRFLNYRVFMSFVQLIYSLLSTGFRKQKPHFTRKDLHCLCEAIKKYPTKSMKEIIKLCELGNYGTKNAHLNIDILSHPDYPNDGRDLDSGFAKELILKAKKAKNREWINIVTR